jgi:RimJ/RimL family protein N-acetyltransferase
VLAAVSKITSLTDADKIIVKPDEANTVSCRTLLSAGFTYDNINRIYVMYLQECVNA